MLSSDQMRLFERAEGKADKPIANFAGTYTDQGLTLNIMQDGIRVWGSICAEPTCPSPT